MSTVGEYNASVIMRGVDDGVGLENTVNSFQVTPREGLLELRAGNPGETGPEGPAAYPWKWRGDVADQAALEALRPTLGIAHRGYAYRVVSANSVMYWDGESFYPFLNAFGAEGPQGSATTLTIGTVTTLAEGSSATATITGTPPNQVLNLGIPRGGKGDEGDPGQPGPIRTAADYDNTNPPMQDSVLAWDSATSKWRPMPYPAWRGPWGIGASNFSSGSNVTAAPATVATITIPGQPMAWRPYIQGRMIVRAHSTGDTRCDVEVRIGHAGGDTVALGVGISKDMWVDADIRPFFGSTNYTPDNGSRVVAAGSTVTLYVVVTRPAGAGAFSYMNQNAELIVWAQPYYAP